MKIAGRKNDGAWYRTNEWIKSSFANNSALTAKLRAGILNLPTIGNFVDDLTDLANQTDDNGVGTNVISNEAIAAAYSTQGIPRCVWNGKLSFDTYTRVEEDGKVKYKPDHPDNVRLFSIDVRDLCKRMMFGDRQIQDALNVRTRAGGNPGGIANATKGD